MYRLLYAPKSNPGEYLNRHFKTALRTGPVNTHKKSLREKATAFEQSVGHDIRGGQGVFPPSRRRLWGTGHLRAGLIVWPLPAEAAGQFV